MTRTRLAKLLVESGTVRERSRLLKSHASLVDLRLAEELRAICYRFWTSEPIKARRAASAVQLAAEAAPSKEMEPIVCWVKGIADITRGDAAAANENLRKATDLFVRNGREHEAAQPMVARLFALAMLGDYGRAINTGKTALRIFTKYGDELAAGKIELNLSNILSRQERHRDAEKYCLSALKRFTSLGETTWRTMAENGLANTYAELNDFERSRDFYNRALRSATAAGMTVTEAEIEASLGTLESIGGNYGEALRLFEGSRSKYDTLRMPHQSAIAASETGGIYAELGLWAEAFDIYKKAVPKLKRLKLRAEEARAAAAYGRAAQELGKRKLAANQFERAVKLYRGEGNPVGAGLALLALAGLELAAGKFGPAKRYVRRGRKLLKDAENTRHLLAADWLEAEIRREAGDLAAADELLRSVKQKADELGLSGYTLASLNSLGKLAEARGDAQLARGLYRQAVEVAETLRSPLPGERIRMAFLGGKLGPYEGLLRSYLAEGRVEDAFYWAERSRARTLTEAMERGNGGDKLGGLHRAEIRKLRDQLNRQYADLDKAGGNAARSSRTVTQLEKRIAELELRDRSSSDDLTAAGPAAGRVSLRSLQGALGAENVLIEYMEADGSVSAIVVTEKRIELFRDIARREDIRAGLEQLRFQFESLKFGQGNLAGLLPFLKKKADAVLAALYSRLVQPIAGAIEEKSLILVPAGVLHYVPFQALHTGDRYLIESHTINYAASAAAWLQLRSRKKCAPVRKALLVGYADASIPQVDSEIRALEGIFGESLSLTGKDAKFRACLDAAGGRDLIHFACHGTFRPDNPMYSSLHLADGWVTVGDICDTRLNAELVTLSACETGLREVAAGEEILGLARGFLTAGTNNVVLSLWTVNDAATAALMGNFYEEMQRGTSIAASLRNAQIRSIIGGDHPYLWAPFFLIGK